MKYAVSSYPLTTLELLSKAVLDQAVVKFKAVLTRLAVELKKLSD